MQSRLYVVMSWGDEGPPPVALDHYASHLLPRLALVGPCQFTDIRERGNDSAGKADRSVAAHCATLWYSFSMVLDCERYLFLLGIK